MKVELIIVFLFIVLLTGVPHTLYYFGNLAKANPISNVGVGLILFLGFYGLQSIYLSIRYKDEKRRYRVLFSGVVCVLIAYGALEVLLAQMGRM